jgi:hypothetical protein
MAVSTGSARHKASWLTPRGLCRFGPAIRERDETVNDQQATQEELLGATTPEALATLMAKAGESQGVTDPNPGTSADAGATGQGADGATPGTGEAQPTGIATKSGTGVLPYRVLEEAREEKGQWRTRATTAEQERDTARQQLTELQSKAVPDALLNTARELTDSELDDLKYLNPKAHKAVMQVRELAGTPPPAPAAAPAAPPTKPEPTPQQQEVADEATAALQQRTLLKGLYGGPLWADAVKLDAALERDPAWTGKSMSERFAEVEKRMAKTLGVQLATGSTPSPTPPPPAPAPAPAEDTPSFRPNTLSDLVSGAPPNQGDGFSDQASGMAMVNRFRDMSDSQMQAVIRRSSGG